MLPAAVQGFFAAHTRRDPHLLDPVLSADFVGHVQGRELRGPAAMRQEVERMAASFPDASYSVLDGVREGDRVAVRWEMSLPPRGRAAPVRVGGLTLFRVPAGHIAELWSFMDGAAPRP